MTNLETIFAVIDTWTDMIDKKAKAIFEVKVISHEDELIAEFSILDIWRSDHADIVNFILESKIVATATVEKVILRMENLLPSWKDFERN